MKEKFITVNFKKNEYYFLVAYICNTIDEMKKVGVPAPALLPLVSSLDILKGATNE